MDLDFDGLDILKGGPPDDLCTCGCQRDVHRSSGKCMYCMPPDCQGFTLDEEGTYLRCYPDPFEQDLMGDIEE